ncbi:DUF6221 family protein [Actinocrispum wychmicini]|uniref:Uncharacterized protein n=1 Tax=Actinocrispum wychmicini TaxID=1213861 RepID=A0A4R2JF10_9PSEU|nr:DUF6221 family protein [Actinocrispum wychmicini]TCO57147.1 hypothetical protein EV192_106624 [Actinocrispum wychmicini]
MSDNDIVEFIRARLDEESALAQLVKEAHVFPDDHDRAGAAYWPTGRVESIVRSYPKPGHRAGLDLIVTFGPDRVLRAVEAKRAVVETCLFFTPDRFAARVFKDLATEWSTHPDYRLEWTP